MDELLAGRYRRVRTLGTGGMGEVWLAEDTELGRQVAIKRLRTNVPGALDSGLVDRMTREARIAARLEHPNIVGLYDIVRVDGAPYLVMHFVDGETLADRIERSGRLAPSDAAHVIAQIAHALDAAHRAGIVHRDVKPANILLDPSGRARLTDFGIARGSGDAAITDAGQMLGTVAYMAPEVARTGVATAASDVWSLGATLFAAVDGHAPFAKTGESNPTILIVRAATQPAPPPEHAGPLTGFVMRMLSSEPDERPRAAEVARVLADAATIAADRTTVVSPRAAAPPAPFGAASHVGGPTPVQPVAKRRRGALLVAAGVVVVAAVVIAVLLATRGSGKHPSAARPGYATRIVATISIGDAPSGVAITPDGSHAYVTNIDGTVSVIDLASNAIVHTIRAGTNRLYAVTIAPDGKHAYVANTGKGGAVSVVDTSTDKITARIQVSTRTIFGVAVTPNGRRAYATAGGGTVAVIDTASNRVVATIAIDSTPHAIVFSSDGSHAYTTNSGGTVSLVDTGTNTITGTIRIGAAPHGFAIMPGGKHAYTTNDGGTVSVIDTATNKVTHTIKVGSDPRGLAVAPDGKHVYVADLTGRMVSVIDTATNEITNTIRLAASPHGVAVARGGNRVYIATGDFNGNRGGGAVAVLGP